MAIFITHFETRRQFYKSTFKIDEEFLYELNKEFIRDATPETYFEITEDKFRDIYLKADESIVYTSVYNVEKVWPVLYFIGDFLYDYARYYEHELYDSDLLDEDFEVSIVDN